MPSLSPTMTQGNIAAWHKKEGDSIAPGDVIAEVETDKATMEWEAQEEGFLAKIVAPAGSKDIPVGTVVAVVVEDAADVAAVRDGWGAAAPAPAAAPAASAPAAAAAAPPPASSSSFPPHEVLNMPALSPTMSAGSIVSWAKKVGDRVAPGDVLCEVETDKASMEWEAQEEGFVAALLLEAGARDIPVGAPALVLVEDAEAVAAFAAYTAADAAPGVPAAAAAPVAAAPAAAAPAAPKASAPAPRAVSAPAAPGARIVASPYARRLAAEAGVSLAGTAGSGPGGRIIAEDVRQLVASGGGRATAAAAPGAGAGAHAGGGASDPPSSSFLADQAWTDEAVNNVKRVTAARLLESKTTIPHYYLTMEVSVDALSALRAQVNEGLAAAAAADAAGGRGGAPAGGAGGAQKAAKLSVNDFIVKAAALACKRVPEVNASWMGDFVRRYHRVDVNVAVMTPAGLMVPFVAGAEAKGVAAIGAEVRDLAARAKAGALRPAEFVGGTFTVSNLGMYGIKQFAAIVNPPQAAILAVGAALPKVVRAAAAGGAAGAAGGGGGGSNGGWRESQVVLATLSCDHRVVDGAVGAEWLRAFKHYIENPLTMLV